MTTEKMPADMLTKRLAGIKPDRHRLELGINFSGQSSCVSTVEGKC